MHLRLIRRMGSRRTRFGVFLIAAVVFLGFSLAVTTGLPLVLTTLFVGVPIIFAAVFATAWLLAADLLDGANQTTLAWAYSRIGASSRINVGPFMLAYVNATLGCLLEAGFSYKLADHAWNAIDSLIYGFTLQELNFPIEPDKYADAAQDYTSRHPLDDYPYLNALAQEVIAGRHDGVQDFALALNLVLEGLERLRQKAA